MRPRLIVRLPAEADQPAHWVLTDDQGRAEGSSVQGNPEGMAEAARGREVIALIPGVEVLLTAAIVPTQNRNRVARAVPFALEDQLTAEVDTLHFALGRMDGSGQVAVAVADRERLRAMFDGLRAQDVEARQAFPETLALPLREDAWTLLVDGDRFLLRSGEQSGIAGDTANLALLLEAALAEAAAPPLNLLVWYVPGSEPELPEGAPAADLQVVADPTALLAEHVDPRRNIALRTGDLAGTAPRQALWRRWRPAAVLALILVLVGTGRGWAERWQLERELAGLESRIGASFRDAFPDGRVPSGQQATVMRSRLTRLREGGGGGEIGMLMLLDRAAPALSATGDLTLEAIGYRAGGLDLELRTESLQTIETLEQRLGGRGLRVEVEQARAEGERVRGRLRVEAAP